MRKASINILFLLLSAVGIYAQSGSIIESGETYLKSKQKRDSVLIADHLRYGFELKGVEQGVILNTPLLSDTLMTGVMVVSPFKLEKTSTKSQGEGYPDLIDYRGEVVITSFDEGIYYLPPLTLQSISPLGVVDTLVFSPQVLEVKTVPVDTASFTPHDLKGIIEYPVTFKEVGSWILLILGIIAIIALIVWGVVVFYRRKHKMETVVKEPAHIVALRELENYRDKGMWAPEFQKMFYSGITDVLRAYISDRYEFGALEMTTAEILNEFKGKDVPDELMGELKVLFQTADQVKFAKMIVDEHEVSTALPIAVKFVTSTYQAELENDKEVL